MTRRPDPLTVLLDAITRAAAQANDTTVSEGEARRWSPVVTAAQTAREETEG